MTVEATSSPHSGSEGNDIVIPVENKNSHFTQETSHGKILDVLGNERNEINYTQIKKGHAELIEDKKEPAEIAQWLGERLGIESWANRKFMGEFEALPTPKQSEVIKLQKFIESLGIEWNPSNGPLEEHASHFCLDTETQYALFGIEMLGRLDPEEWYYEWYGNFELKAQHLAQKIGLTVEPQNGKTDITVLQSDQDLYIQQGVDRGSHMLRVRLYNIGSRREGSRALGSTAHICCLNKEGGN